MGDLNIDGMKVSYNKQVSTVRVDKFACFNFREMGAKDIFASFNFRGFRILRSVPF